jgi:hypothetical protein
MASLGDFPFTPREFSLVLRVNTRANAAPGGGSEQAVDLLNDRWVCSMTLPVRRHETAAALEAFLNRLRGMTNTVNIWHMRRPAPRGTIAGTVLTNGSQAQGAASLVLDGATAGTTVLAGDMLGAGGQLLQVATDATADGSGNMTVALANRLRAAIADNQAVTLTRPSVPMRLMASEAGVNLVPGFAEEVRLMFGEVIA